MMQQAQLYSSRELTGDVTRALESESPTSSSRCDTDDDDSSTDSEDGDDPLSLKLFATADDYNLKTFGQTEYETWAINHPLPLPLWAEKSKPALNIDQVNS